MSITVASFVALLPRSDSLIVSSHCYRGHCCNECCCSLRLLHYAQSTDYVAVVAYQWGSLLLLLLLLTQANLGFEELQDFYVLAFGYCFCIVI